jgi:colanic acid biosynthesis glycosyl transferase WcaI
MRIRICSLNYTPEISGVAPYTAGLAIGLTRRGHQVEVETSLPHYPEWQVHPDCRALSGTRVVDDGVVVRRFGHYVPSVPTLRRRALFEAAFGSRLMGSSWSKVDLVLTTSPSLIASAMVIARAKASGTPVGVIAHDLYAQGAIETRALTGSLARAAARFEGAVLNSATGVVVIHDRFRPKAVDLGVDPNKLTTIRNWSHVDPPRSVDRVAVRRKHGWRADERIVVHSGNMGAKQGLENVVAAARCADERGTDIRFVLMGDGNQRAFLEAKARGVKHIEFKNAVDEDEYCRVLACADVLLANERAGIAEMAVPSKLTSYFSAGRAVLAATASNGVLAQEVTGAGAGLVVAAGDPAALLDAAVYLSDHPDVSNRLGDAGREYASRLLGMDNALDQYERWCDQLTAVGAREAGRATVAGDALAAGDEVFRRAAGGWSFPRPL